MPEPATPRAPLSHELHLLGLLPDVVFRYRLRPTPACEYITPSVAELTGYAPAEYYADPRLPWRLVHPDDLAAFDAAVADPDDARTYVLRWRTRDGGDLLLEKRMRGVRDAAGTVVAIVGVCRPAGAAAGERQLERGGVRVDLVAQRAFVEDRSVALTPSEHRILALLALEDASVSRRRIVRHLWGHYHVSGERAVEVHISNLRRKLETDPQHPTRVLTVRGVGYRLVRPPRDAAQSGQKTGTSRTATTPNSASNGRPSFQ